MNPGDNPAQEEAWPRFLAMEDFGPGLRFTVLDADGSTREIIVRKRFKLNQPEVYDPPLLRHVAERDFDLSTPQSLVFTLGGGIGDVIFAVQAVQALRRFLRERSTAEFEFIGLMHDDLLAIIHRFLGAAGTFDRVLGSSAREITSRFGILPLDATPHQFRAGDLTLGNVWDHLWWKWGLPGHFPGLEGVPTEGLKTGAVGELAALRRDLPGFPQPGNYLVLADDATMLRGKKDWPTPYWSALIEWVLRETPLDVVVMMTAERARALPADERVFVYDFRQLGSRQVCVDLLRLCSVVEGSRGVVSVDSGVAHVAALLDKPCITLWGPTRPITHGQPRNINLRLSSCPPCCAESFRQSVCARAVCMEEIPAATVISVLGDLLQDPVGTRRKLAAR